MKRVDVRDALVERGVRPDWASQYADLFCEYREAVRNIEDHGSIVQHPRTGNPISNPYVAIRDAAFRKLRLFRGFNPAFLWNPTAPHAEPDPVSQERARSDADRPA